MIIIYLRIDCRYCTEIIIQSILCKYVLLKTTFPFLLFIFNHLPDASNRHHFPSFSGAHLFDVRWRRDREETTQYVYSGNVNRYTDRPPICQHIKMQRVSVGIYHMWIYVFIYVVLFSVNMRTTRFIGGKYLSSFSNIICPLVQI